MSIITAAQVRKIARGPVNESNLQSALIALDQFGPGVGLDKPWRAAQYLAQLMHESGEFKFDRELWGPTPAQRRYDVRADLGNTTAADGDGYLYRGRGPIQITGKANYRYFTCWAREQFPKVDVPDFVKSPDAVLTDPWEGLGPIWYWARNNINRFADRGDVEMVTRTINGGLNGIADRLDLYTRTALVMLGYGPTAVKRFQIDAGLKVADGIAGPATRAALHKALKAA